MCVCVAHTEHISTNTKYAEKCFTRHPKQALVIHVILMCQDICMQLDIFENRRIRTPFNWKRENKKRKTSVQKEIHRERNHDYLVSVQGDIWKRE